MDVEAVKCIPTPLSPSKRDRLMAMGSVIAGGSKAVPTKHLSDSATPRLSEELLNSSVGSGQDEFNRILLMRRSKVDGEGTTWESPAGRQSTSSGHDDCLAGRLAHCCSTPVPSTPEHGPAPWPSSGRPRGEGRHIDVASFRSARSSIEGGLPSTPPQKKMAAAPRLTDEQMTSIAPHLSPEQLEVLSGVFVSSQTGPIEEDELQSQASSGNDTGETVSSHSPKRGTARSRRGSTSCPPKPGSLYDEVPKYPELRKRRSLGNKRVRFQEDHGEKMDSDDDKSAAPTPGNICLQTRGRRVSRGPDGAPYKVDMHSDDDESEDAEARAPSASGLSVGTYATAVARGATGAFCGGATGAAVGLGGALFTFGLSVPICALVGSTYGGFYGVSSALPEEDRPQQAMSSTHAAGNSQRREGGSAPPSQEATPSETSRRRRHSRQ